MFSSVSGTEDRKPFRVAGIGRMHNHVMLALVSYFNA